MTLQARRSLGQGIVGIWGNVLLKEKIENNELVGYQITCGRHRNVADELPCGKHLYFGTGDTRLTPEECMRRLKRWYITAKHVEHGWAPETSRDIHVKEWGGRRLKNLASSVDPWPSLTDDNLDEMVMQVEAIA